MLFIVLIYFFLVLTCVWWYAVEFMMLGRFGLEVVAMISCYLLDVLFLCLDICLI